MERDCESELSKLNIEQNACIYHFGASVIHGQRSNILRLHQIKLIMECRQSELSDYQWCEQNGIHPGTFYNWVSKLRKSGYSLPDVSKRSEMKPAVQEWKS